MSNPEIFLQSLPENEFPALDHRTFIGDPSHVLEGSLWRRYYSQLHSHFNEIVNHELHTFKISIGDAMCYISAGYCFDFNPGVYDLITKCTGFEVDTTRYGGLATDSGMLGVISMNMDFARDYTSTVYARDYTKAVLDFQKKILVEKDTIIETILKAPGIFRIRIKDSIPAATDNTSKKGCLQQTLF